MQWLGGFGRFLAVWLASEYIFEWYHSDIQNIQYILISPKSLVVTQWVLGDRSKKILQTWEIWGYTIIFGFLPKISQKNWRQKIQVMVTHTKTAWNNTLNETLYYTSVAYISIHWNESKNGVSNTVYVNKCIGQL